MTKLPNSYIDAIRFLAMDAVEKAQSGHPGMPMGMAEVGATLWHEFLNHNPNNPQWINRDRFVLSNGHGSMLLYALLHLTGYDLSIDDLKAFRQLHSKTPGHPEVNETPGVETTTGPLAQGLANGVGMALAEKILAKQFNRGGFDIIDHYTYVFCGDGCLMEGLSHEVCSLAGTLELNKLIVLWDDNGISIDGELSAWFSDNTPKRFEAYNWQVIPNVNGHNTEEIHLTRQALKWSHEPFHVSPEIYAAFNAREKGAILEKNWQAQYQDYKKHYPHLAEELERRIQGDILPEVFEQLQNLITTQDKAIATRAITKTVLKQIISSIPEILGGSADLSESNGTLWPDAKILSAQNSDANYIHYGVREFAMAAIMNGIALHRGFIPFGGTFLIFSAYCASAIRMSALMKQRVIYVLTHDSIGLGEDGPTHQPIEQLAMLRAIPHLQVWRPCDAAEAIVAWEMSLRYKNGPSALLMSRQKLAYQSRSAEQLENIKRGGYVVYEDKRPKFIIIATGSELEIAVDVAKQSKQRVRVVSMPCLELFEQQDAEYKESVLPKKIKKRLAIEAANSDIWYKYLGGEGRLLDLKEFGLSAPAKEIFQERGLTVKHVLVTLASL